jgi:hypothetical protein
MLKTVMKMLSFPALAMIATSLSARTTIMSARSGVKEASGDRRSGDLIIAAYAT